MNCVPDSKNLCFYFFNSFTFLSVFKKILTYLFYYFRSGYQHHYRGSMSPSSPSRQDLISRDDLGSHYDMSARHEIPARLDLPAEENIELEELEEFAKEFKQRRIKLGYTQVCKTDYKSPLKYFYIL